eukprot:s2112_g8.t1
MANAMLSAWVGLNPVDAERMFTHGAAVAPHYQGRWGIRPTPQQAFERCRDTDFGPGENPDNAEVEEALEGIGEGWYRFHGKLEAVSRAEDGTLLYSINPHWVQIS